MKYTWLTIGAVVCTLTGYGLLKSGSRVVHVQCERTEQAFLPICEVREYLFGLPNGSPQRVADVTSLGNSGKETRDFFLLRRLSERKSAPIALNRVRTGVNAGPADREPIASLNHLATFFAEPSRQNIAVQLKSEAGSPILGGILFIIGIVALFVLPLLKKKSTRSSGLL